MQSRAAKISVENFVHSAYNMYMKIFKKIFTVVTWSVLLFSCRSTETQKNANSEISEVEEELLQNHDGSASEYAEKESAEQRKKNSEPAAAESVADSASNHSGKNASQNDPRKKTEKTMQENLTIKERSDYRTYINGTYRGLTYRESELYLKARPTAGGKIFSGQALVIQDTRRNMLSTAKKVDETLAIRFNKAENGQEVFLHDSGFPLFREFFDSLNKNYAQLADGTSWEAPARVSVFPLKERGAVELPVLVQYTFAGTAQYFGKEVFKVLACYALRNNKSGEFTTLNGKRQAEIFLEPQSNRVLFVREKVLEEFCYADGTRVKNDGSLLHFYAYAQYVQETVSDTEQNIISVKTEPIAPADTAEIPSEHKQPELVEFPQSEHYRVTKNDMGITLQLKNLRFAADQAVLLSGEEIKLDEVAAILKQFPHKKFFIEGHTASTGQAQKEKILSEQRALVVLSELVKRGIPEPSFLYAGAGATKPLADNKTAEGKAKNRRVEITILEN